MTIGKRQQSNREEKSLSVEFVDSILQSIWE